MDHVSRKILMTFALATGMASTAASAQTVRVEQDPAVGGQLNQCWGSIASQTAKLDTSGVDAEGGGMGIHSRAAAGQGTTFGDAFGFNATPGDDGGNGRTGVGNVSANSTGPHRIAPGDGGNGQHAINNGTTLTDAFVHSRNGTTSTEGFSNRLDPLTGLRAGVRDASVVLICDSKNGALP